MPTFDSLRLPPPFEPIVLAEGEDAFEYATRNAETLGAATVVVAPKVGQAEFAVVLEPEETLAAARLVVYAAGNALYNAIATQAPPQHAVGFDWPGTLRVDDTPAGGLRLGIPAGCREDDVPEFLVVGVTMRLERLEESADPEPLFTPGDEDGVEAFSATVLVADFCRYFAREISDWQADGFRPLAERWLFRAHAGDLRLDDSGDGRRGEKVLSLAAGLAKPLWLDAPTGEPAP